MESEDISPRPAVSALAPGLARSEGTGRDGPARLANPHPRGDAGGESLASGSEQALDAGQRPDPDRRFRAVRPDTGKIRWTRQPLHFTHFVVCMSQPVQNCSRARSMCCAEVKARGADPVPKMASSKQQIRSTPDQSPV